MSPSHCGDLNENDHRRLIYLDIWFTSVGTVWEGLGYGLVGRGSIGGWTLRFQNHIPSPVSPFCLWLYVKM